MAVSTRKRISVLGYGHFGRTFTELLAENNFEVCAFDIRVQVPKPYQVDSLQSLLTHGQIIFLAIPVLHMQSALREIFPLLQPDQIVIDAGSVKVQPQNTMQEILGTRIPWVATHPLFGPVSLLHGDRPLRVVICPNPLHPHATLQARHLYEQLGCELIEQDAVTHDQIMAETHALTFFIAKGLIDIGVGENTTFVPPSFTAILHMIETVRADAGHLFTTINQENTFAHAARKRFMQALNHVDCQLQEQNFTTASKNKSMIIPDLEQKSPELVRTRELIDKLDHKMVHLLARRAQLAKRAGVVKAKNGLPIRDSQRELNLLETRVHWAEKAGLDPETARNLFEAIMKNSRMLQSEK